MVVPFLMIVFRLYLVGALYQCLSSPLVTVNCSLAVLVSYLFKHSLGVGYSRGFLPASPPVSEMLSGGELVHGDHGTAGLLPPQLQHGEQVQGDGAHVGQRANLQISLLTFSPRGCQITGASEREV